MTKIEICCASAADALAAKEGGADRIELNSAIELGGLTPSLAQIEMTKKLVELPVLVMIRPRSYGFCYSKTEFKIMQRDASLALAAGADGIVFGILTSDGQIDLSRNKIMADIAGDKEAVFHRAFDVVADPWQAVDQLASLNIDRILTSAQQPKVNNNLSLAKKIIDYAAGKLEIVLGGGIRAHNAAEIIKSTGCNQIHLTAFSTNYDLSLRHKPEGLNFNSKKLLAESEYGAIDPEKVKVISELIK
jgi:copper homeostasis protein